METRSWSGAGRRWLALLLLLVLAWPAPASAQDDRGLTVVNDNGNAVASGSVKTYRGPTDAIVLVENERPFWIAVDRELQHGSLILTEADVADDAGAMWTRVAVVPPHGTVAFRLSWDPSVGGDQTVTLHYDGTTPGGVTAVALNILQLVAFGLGEGQLAGSAEAVAAAARTITSAPEFVEVIRSNQGRAAGFSDMGAYVRALLGTSAGRAAIIEALSQVGVAVTDGGLRVAERFLLGYDALRLVVGIIDATLSGRTRGSVQFAALAQDQPGSGSGSAAAETIPAMDFLKAGIPEGLRCKRGDMDLVPGTIAALDCRPDWEGVDLVSYRLMPPDAARKAFTERMAAQGARKLGDSECARGRVGWGESLPLVQEGCFVDGDGHASLRWLVETSCPSVYVAAYGQERDVGYLREQVTWALGPGYYYAGQFPWVDRWREDGIPEGCPDEGDGRPNAPALINVDITEVSRDCSDRRCAYVLDVSWHDRSAVEDGFRVEFGDKAVTVGPDERSARIKGSTRRYSWPTVKVIAVNDSGGSRSRPVDTNPGTDEGDFR